MNDAPPVKPAIPHDIKRHVVNRCIDEESLKAPHAWGRELKILNKLIERHPEQGFWERFTPTNIKLRSFAFYINGVGMAQLRERYTQYIADFDTANPSALRHHTSPLSS